MAPASGPSQGGTRLIITGKGFDSASTVYICGIPARAIGASETEMVIVTPAVPRDGYVNLRVVDAEDQAHVVERAFCYEAALAPPVITGVSPNRGSSQGGQRRDPRRWVHRRNDGAVW